MPLVIDPEQSSENVERGPPACVLPLSMPCKLLVSARVSESCSELKAISLKGELI